MTLLRQVAKHLGLPKGTFEVRFNPGGIAVSGDATLHGENIYITLNADMGLGVLVRTCKGRKDYTGGMNCWYGFDFLADKGAAGLADFARKVAGTALREQSAKN